MESIKRLMRHYPSTTVMAILCIALVVWMAGCESKAESIVRPGEMVTATELAMEVESEAKRIDITTTSKVAMLQAEIDRILAEGILETNNMDLILQKRQAQIERQDEFKNTVLEIGLAYASGQPVNPLGVALTLAGLLGVGAIADNKIKDRIIKSKEPPSS